MITRNRLALISLGVLLVAVTAGGVYFANQTNDTSSNGAAQATATPQTSPSPTPTPAPSTTTPECATADLSAALLPANSAAGTSYQSLALTNTSGTSCTISGYPGVSLVDASGAMLGQPATRNAALAPVSITLNPSQAAYAVLGFPNPDNFEAGKCSARASALKIYPPNQTASLSTPATQAFCPGFSVEALSATQQ